MLASINDTSRCARALHRVLVKARLLALQDGDASKLAAILDWAEILADDIAQDRDEDFAEHLEGLGANHPELAGISREHESQLERE